MFIGYVIHQLVQVVQKAIQFLNLNKFFNLHVLRNILDAVEKLPTQCYSAFQTRIL